jgi:hypothetical protein
MWLSHVVKRGILSVPKFPSFRNRNYTTLLTKAIPRIYHKLHNSRLKYSFKYNQRDATLYNNLYCCQCSTCFRRFFRPSSGAQTVYTASGICQACLLLTLAWVIFQLTYASGSSKQAWHIPDAVYTVWAPDDGQKNRLKPVEHWQQ